MATHKHSGSNVGASESAAAYKRHLAHRVLVTAEKHIDSTIMNTIDELHAIVAMCRQAIDTCFSVDDEDSMRELDVRLEILFCSIETIASRMEAIHSAHGLMARPR